MGDRVSCSTFCGIAEAAKVFVSTPSNIAKNKLVPSLDNAEAMKVLVNDSWANLGRIGGCNVGSNVGHSSPFPRNQKLLCRTYSYLHRSTPFGYREYCQI